MRISFVAPAEIASAALVAHIVDQNGLPENLDPVLVAGAKASRFAGKAGQIFDGFVARGDKVVRVALAGAGEAGAKGRTGALEKAGAGLVARYLTCGGGQTCGRCAMRPIAPR